MLLLYICNYYPTNDCGCVDDPLYPVNYLCDLSSLGIDNLAAKITISSDSSYLIILLR